MKELAGMMKEKVIETWVSVEHALGEDEEEYEDVLGTAAAGFGKEDSEDDTRICQWVEDKKKKKKKVEEETKKKVKEMKEKSLGLGDLKEREKD